MSDEEAEETNSQMDISVKINPIRRLCRYVIGTSNAEDAIMGLTGTSAPIFLMDCGRTILSTFLNIVLWKLLNPLGQEDMDKSYKTKDESRRPVTKEPCDDEDYVVACPVVLRQTCAQLRAQSGRGSRSSVKLPAIHSHLSSLPYWRRCLCSPVALPPITERELVPLLSLTAPHRFIVIVVTSSSDNIGSVVVGGESLIEAVYSAQNLPGLRPCLQSPSEPSLAFVKYYLSKPRTKRKERRPTPITVLNGGQVKVGMVLIYQKTQMLYAGFPLASYGCSKQDFLTFISKYTQYNFHLRTPELDQEVESQSVPDSEGEEERAEDQ